MRWLAFVGVLIGTACWSASTTAAPDPTGPAQPPGEKAARLADRWHIAFSPKTKQLAVRVEEQYCGEVLFNSTDVVIVSSAGLEEQVLPWIKCEDFDQYDSAAGDMAHSRRARAAIESRRATIDGKLAAGGFVPLRLEARADVVVKRDHVRLVRSGKELARAPRRKDLDQHDREAAYVRHAAHVPALEALAVVLVPSQTPRSHYEYAQDRFEILLLKLPR